MELRAEAEETVEHRASKVVDCKLRHYFNGYRFKPFVLYYINFDRL
jgi:hypothetical protein